MEQRCSVACFLKECINTQKLLYLNSFLFNIAKQTKIILKVII